MLWAGGLETIRRFQKHQLRDALHLREYFEAPGMSVMAFQDIYPDGHQGDVSIIQNGVRVATNGDIRLDPAPGQWQPMPKQDGLVVDTAINTVRPPLTYPDAIASPFLRSRHHP